MEEEYLKQQQLLARYNAGLCSPEELRMINYWYNLETQSAADQFEEPDYTQLRNEIWAKLPVAMEPVRVDRGNVVRLTGFKWAAVAAVILMVIGAGLVFLNRQQPPEHSAFANDVTPGSNKAVLTLANGKAIPLSDAKTGVVINAMELKYNDGSKVRVSSESKSLEDPSLYNKEKELTAATPRGGTYQITLSDGTRVWLNADSKISFPAQFSGKERRIKLSGEAYFEVATAYMSMQGRRAKQSFIVVTDNQQVEVLGTHFNINSYAGEGQTKTTLLEGSVKVSSRNHATNEVVLKPDQQASLSNAGQFKVLNVDAEDAVAWKNGLFLFQDDEPLESVMRKVALWYNVEIVYQDEAIRKHTYGGSVSRFGNVSTVLRMLEKAGDVHFKIEGRKIIVDKK